jgi:hypothetical protein
MVILTQVSADAIENVQLGLRSWCGIRKQSVLMWLKLAMQVHHRNELNQIKREA